MKRAPMKWIDRLAITSYGGLTIVSALRTEWFIAYLAASLAVTVWLMSLHEREAAYQKRRADMLDALLKMELGDALHTALNEWHERGQR